jgi:hypothetical protein
MSKDRYERKHRRTHKHPESIAMMAGANFDAVPSLAEAMGATDYLAMTVTSQCSYVTEEQWARGGDLPSGQVIVPGTVVKYVAHVVGGMVKVRHNGAVVVIHPGATDKLGATSGRS